MFLQTSVEIQQNTVLRCKENRKNSLLRFFQLPQRVYFISAILLWLHGVEFTILNNILQ